MLTNKIQDLTSPTDPNLDATDLFEQSLFTIFSDSRNQHGEPGQYVLYKGGKYSDVKLRLADPDPSNHSLFSHFVWNAGLQAAEMITDRTFDVVGRRVLEVGAGAGLPGVIAVLAGADEVVLSDYPAPEVLSNIKHNLELNLSPAQLQCASVAGHVWGVTSDELCVKRAGDFDRVIAADCFWMDLQHDNLARSIKLLLAGDGLLLAIAGFHTGRAKVAGFFHAAERAGLRCVSIMEKDVEGSEREWVMDRGQEDPVERKRWLVIGVFTHTDS